MWSSCMHSDFFVQCSSSYICRSFICIYIYKYIIYIYKYIICKYINILFSYSKVHIFKYFKLKSVDTYT